MARTPITPGVVTRDGLNVATVTEADGDVANGHTIPNRGLMWVQARNSGAVSRNITFALKGAVDGYAVQPRVEAVAAGLTVLFGPFDSGDYGGNLLVDVAHAELKLKAFELQV